MASFHERISAPTVCVGDEATFHWYHFGNGVRKRSCIHCVAAHEIGEEEREAYILNIASAEYKAGTWRILH
jgi:hypothetical protein